MMPAVLRSSLEQRADYTQKLNAKSGRHGWLRLTPAYSLKIVDEILDTYDDGSRIHVLDPFCGTGTTALCAASRGHRAVTAEINPFLVWFSHAKTDCYSPRSIAGLRQDSLTLLDDVRSERTPKAPIPCMHNIERWWNPAALDFLRALKGVIDSRFDKGTKPHSLLLVAFCRVLIKLSNAAFDHQSMSFKSDHQAAFDFETDRDAVFLSELDFVLAGAQQNPAGAVHVRQTDARRLSRTVTGPVDCVITSPPYVNRMSYIRELRPYMYWLGHLANGRDAGEMDWEAIGGTWGVATSRLNDWTVPADGFQSERLRKAAEKIGNEDHKNGRLLANYVLKYFDDVWRHFQSLPEVLNHGAQLHYIVGNSTFYGVLVPVEQIYAEMLCRLGFSNVAYVPIRKRNSKKALLEFDVRARWQ